MRKFDELVNTKFNGNLENALNYLMFEMSSDEGFKDYFNELTDEEFKIVVKLVDGATLKHYGGMENLKKAIKKEVLLKTLDLTEEEVKNAKVNPYKANLLKGLLKMLIMEGGVIAVSLAAGSFGFDPSTLGIFNSLAIGLGSVTVANNLLSYTRFKKLKKMMENENVKLENNSVGRGL